MLMLKNCASQEGRYRERGKRPARLCYWSVTISILNMKCNYRAEVIALNVGRLASSGMGIVLKRPKDSAPRRVPNRHRFCDDLKTYSCSMSRHSPYHGDYMSRSALPLKLSERGHACGIRSLCDRRHGGAGDSPAASRLSELSDDLLSRRLHATQASRAMGDSTQRKSLTEKPLRTITRVYNRFGLLRQISDPWNRRLPNDRRDSQGR